MNKIKATVFGSVLAGFVALFAPAASATPSGDCARVARADYSLCEAVKAQHAYGWTNNIGDPLNWVPKGKTVVREITHQGLTKTEMHSYLTGARADYRAYVTNVSFNVDKIADKCGHHNFSATVRMVRDRDGRLYTWKHVSCN